MLSKLGLTILGNLGLLATAAGATPSYEGWVSVPIPLECKAFYWGDWFLFPGEKPTAEKPDFDLWNPARAKSMAYRDSRTSVTLYVESNGRHLGAIDEAGNLLWVRNVFEDVGLCPYRTPHPIIRSIAIVEIGQDLIDWYSQAGVTLNSGHKFLNVKFDSSQELIVDESSGYAVFAGQN